MQRLVILAALLLACPPSPAAAGEVRSLYRAGCGQVVTGTGDDNRAFCEIASGGAGGRQILILSIAGDPLLNLQMVKPSWAIPPGTPIDVAVTIDGNPWQVHTTGAGTLIGIAIPPQNQPSFEQAFRGGQVMTISFPGGSEQPWTGSLSASNAVYSAFNACRNGISGQPFGGPTATPTVSQPFAPAPPAYAAPPLAPVAPPVALPPLPAAPPAG